uniref:Glutathione S-transferase kappa n=1 Tax=Ciona intestinalis TaxID=7719 RepID=H2XML4_CIOIN|nr:glutathione S-transferase kappa 1-like [Ciona intestinalis]|eukprot:XP_002126524.1 glutathione S-transferase kappa 1-like [Ciona intestinalis]
MAQPMRKILVEFFYDTVSPYSYIAFQVINRCNKSWTNMDLKLKPAFLPAVMQQTNNAPPAMVPARGRYMSHDLLRMADFYKVPFKMPRNISDVMMNKGTISAQRLLTVVATEAPQYLEGLSREIFMRVWVRDEDVTMVESLKDACRAVGMGHEVDQLVGKMAHTDVKDELRRVTQEAIDYGSFGMPTFVAHLTNEPTMLFGSDRLFLLAYYLKQSWPCDVTEAKL